jgi:hypothetical protein
LVNNFGKNPLIRSFPCVVAQERVNRIMKARGALAKDWWNMSEGERTSFIAGGHSFKVWVTPQVWPSVFKEGREFSKGRFGWGRCHVFRAMLLQSSLLVFFRCFLPNPNPIPS